MALSFNKIPNANPTVCVIGNLTIDVILRGIATLPKWGQEVVCQDRTDSVAGQAGTVAFAASSLGVATQVISAVGDDAAGTRIRHELSSSGIGVDAVAVASGGTPMTVALVRPDGERAFVSDLGTLHDLDLVNTAASWLATHPAGVVALVGTSNLRDLDQDEVVECFRIARQEGAFTVFDPGWDPFGWSNRTRSLINAVLTETDLFLPNQDEAHILTEERELSLMFDNLKARCPGMTVVKGGAMGSYVADGGQIVNVKAIGTSVDNAVGAGDVFDAGVIASYLNGFDVLASLTFASAAASIYVGRRDHRFPEFEECMELAKLVEASIVNR